MKIIIDMLMPVQQNSFTHLRDLLVLTDCGKMCPDFTPPAPEFTFDKCFKNSIVIEVRLALTSPLLPLNSPSRRERDPKGWSMVLIIALGGVWG
jgi:hypothetical protein